MLENPWVPDAVKAGITPKQAEFLVYEGREALFGGAAGGGKSVALLVAALQFVEFPGYSALLLRRTFKQLSKADSILSKAKEWLFPLRDRGVRWNGDEYKFTFPSGATLEFGHVEHEAAVYNYQGGAWAFVGHDEMTQFTPPMITYPRTRLRRVVGSPVPIRSRGASNPGGVGHEFVKERYVKGKDGRDPSTPDRQFFPATLADNPHIDRDDYVRQLRDAGVDPITLAQLLRGDWDAVAGGRFRRDWFGGFRRDRDSPDFVQVWKDGQAVERFSWTQRPRFQTCDPAASTSNAADFFVLSTWMLTPRANVLWWDCERLKLELPDQVTTCQRSYRRHRPQFLAVEEVLNQRGLAQLLRRSTDPAMVVRGVSPLGRDKLARASGLINLAASGRVFLPEDNPAFPLDDVVAELVRFTGDPDQDAHDDVVDTGSYMAELLPGLEPAAGGGRAPSAHMPGAKPAGR